MKGDREDEGIKVTQKRQRDGAFSPKSNYKRAVVWKNILSLSPCVDTPPPPQSSRTRAQCSQRVVSVRTVHGAQYQSCQLVSSAAFFSCPSV